MTSQPVSSIKHERMTLWYLCLSKLLIHRKSFFRPDWRPWTRKAFCRASVGKTFLAAAMFWPGPDQGALPHFSTFYTLVSERVWMHMVQGFCRSYIYILHCATYINKWISWVVNLLKVRFTCTWISSCILSTSFFRPQQNIYSIKVHGRQLAHTLFKSIFNKFPLLRALTPSL